MEKQIPVTKRKLKTEFPYFDYEERFALCGQPQVQDLEEFQKNSWTHVINLRSSQELEELEFNLADNCQKLGFKYSHIPIIVDGDIDKKALKQIHNLLSSKEKEKYVIHCALGGRAVLALMSHFLLSKSWRLDELPSLAEAFEFQKTNMLNRLVQIVESEL